MKSVIFNKSEIMTKANKLLDEINFALDGYYCGGEDGAEKKIEQIRAIIDGLTKRNKEE